MRTLIYAGRLPDPSRFIEVGGDSRYVAQQGCSGCPHRDTCHAARQRVQDGRFATGRHYDCGFFSDIEAAKRAQAPRGFLGRLMGR